MGLCRLLVALVTVTVSEEQYLRGMVIKEKDVLYRRSLIKRFLRLVNVRFLLLRAHSVIRNSNHESVVPRKYVN